MINPVLNHNTRRILMAGLAAALIALGAMLALTLTNTVGAEEAIEKRVTETVTEWPQKEPLTTLTVEGVASRSVSYDGTVGRFTVSVLRSNVRLAVVEGNTSVNAIATSVSGTCYKTAGEVPEGTLLSDEDLPCISPNGLQTRRIRIFEELDWTEQGRVSQGFRYENSLSIAIEGTEFAGGLIDLVIRAGGDHVRFDGLSFTASGRAEAERLALLDAIDDAQATADAIAGHMDYEIVRVVELNPVSSLTATRTVQESAERALADESFEPTPVFGGSESVTARVRIVYELRPLTSGDE